MSATRYWTFTTLFWVIAALLLLINALTIKLDLPLLADTQPDQRHAKCRFP